MTLQNLRYAVMIANTGSMNEAAKKLFISQPSLSAAIQTLEEEIGVAVFKRTNKGVRVTVEGSAFLEHARQIVAQYEFLEHQFINPASKKKHFAISSQHYAFAVRAYIETVKKFKPEEYDTAIRETKTSQIIEDVRTSKSEIGIIYLSESNEKYIKKILKEKQLEFHYLFECGTYAYLWGGNPLSKKDVVTHEELYKYPYLIFEQGDDTASFMSEESESPYTYPNVIRTNDRATMMELIREINAFTICCGIIDNIYKSQGFKAVPISSEKTMKIGYITFRNHDISPMCEEYIKQLKSFENDIQ